jgi:hypothetical protein
MDYPYHSPLVLDDSIFLLYGGATGTASSAQRQAAYLLAEIQMTEYLDTFLVPTIVSGTHWWDGGNPFELDYGHIIQILGVTVADRDWANSCQANVTDGCAAIRNAQYGYIDVSYMLGCGGCSFVGSPPYNIQVVYRSGFYSGTAYQPNILAALSLLAQTNLNDFDASLSNEGAYGVGIQSWSNQSYSETRVKLGKNAFGSSPAAQKIARLVGRYRAKPGLSLHK